MRFADAQGHGVHGRGFGQREQVVAFHPVSARIAEALLEVTFATSPLISMATRVPSWTAGRQSGGASVALPSTAFHGAGAADTLDAASMAGPCSTVGQFERAHHQLAAADLGGVGSAPDRCRQEKDDGELNAATVPRRMCRTRAAGATSTEAAVTAPLPLGRIGPEPEVSVRVCCRRIGPAQEVNARVCCGRIGPEPGTPVTCAAA